MNVLIIGPRGSGKSTVAALLAVRCQRSCIDLDHRVLPQFTQSTIAEVWRVRGEPAWRDAELRSLREILRSDGQVIALGGGTPVIPQAHTLIQTGQRAGQVVVVYLHCSAATLMRRLQAPSGHSRPSLTGEDFITEIPKVLAIREPVYRSLADLIIDADGKSAAAVVDEILAALASRLHRM